MQILELCEIMKYKEEKTYFKWKKQTINALIFFCMLIGIKYEKPSAVNCYESGE